MKRKPTELAIGTQHEREHVDTLRRYKANKITEKQAIKEIAKVHLAETPGYYTKLKKAGISGTPRTSKVVDAQGRPLVVYHGAGTNFDSFDKNKSSDATRYGNGFSFTDSKGIATKYSLDRQGLEDRVENDSKAIIKEAYITISKPFDERKAININTKEAKNLISILTHKYGKNEKLVKNILQGKTKDTAFVGISKAVFNPESDTRTFMFSGNTEKTRQILEDAGYDSIIGEYEDANEYFVFDNKNIESINTRPTTNSLGQPIASTAKGIENFWRWFGDSKVVDEQGRPLVVYHGTGRDFDTFNSTKFVTAGYFAKDPKLASHVAQLQATNNNVIPAYLDIKNLFDLSEIKTGYDDITPQELISKFPINIDEYFKEKLLNYSPNPLFTFVGDVDFIEYVKSKGFDGIAFHELTPAQTEIKEPDGNNWNTFDLDDGLTYVAFYPTQIKSATGNDGSFDKNDSSILSGAEDELINYKNNYGKITETEKTQLREKVFAMHKKYDWDVEFSSGPAKGTLLSQQKLYSLDVYHDNILGATFTDESTFDLKVAETTGLLTITDNPVRISVILDGTLKSTREDQIMLRRIKKLADNSGRVVVLNPSKSRDERIYPFLFVKASEINKYEIATLFDGKLDTPWEAFHKRLGKEYLKIKEEEKKEPTPPTPTETTTELKDLQQYPTWDEAYKFITQLYLQYQAGKKLTQKSILPIAGEIFKTLPDERLLRELTEAAQYKLARLIIFDEQYHDRYNIFTPEYVNNKTNQLFELYKKMPVYDYRDSNTSIFQQFSTPIFIGYLMAVYCQDQNNLDKNKVEQLSVFEPSAGNGLLLPAYSNMNDVKVNEIDPVRRFVLKHLGYNFVLKQDASKPFNIPNSKIVISNPPFFRSTNNKEQVMYGGKRITSFDHICVLRALDKLDDDGKAAFIINGSPGSKFNARNFYDQNGEYTGNYRNFMNYLYAYYNVEDVLHLDGHALYSRQGQATNVVMILINGRRSKPDWNLYPPKYNPAYDDLISSIPMLVNRILNPTRNAEKVVNTPVQTIMAKLYSAVNTKNNAEFEQAKNELKNYGYTVTIKNGALKITKGTPVNTMFSQLIMAEIKATYNL